MVPSEENIRIIEHPDLARVIAHRDDYAVIDWIIENHGVETLHAAVEATKQRHRGIATWQHLADDTALDPETAYQAQEIIHEILDLGYNDPASDDIDTADEPRLTQPVVAYTGFAWLADAKVRLGHWLEKRRNRRPR